MARLPKANGNSEVPAVAPETNIPNETPKDTKGTGTKPTSEEVKPEKGDTKPEKNKPAEEDKPAQDTPDITLTPSVAPVTPSSSILAPLVKIRPKVKHSCTIGGVHYNFEKGKVCSVPANVKSVLSRANLLDPI